MQLFLFAKIPYLPKDPHQYPVLQNFQHMPATAYPWVAYTRAATFCFLSDQVLLSLLVCTGGLRVLTPGCTGVSYHESRSSSSFSSYHVYTDSQLHVRIRSSQHSYLDALIIKHPSATMNLDHTSSADQHHDSWHLRHMVVCML